MFISKAYSKINFKITIYLQFENLLKRRDLYKYTNIFLLDKNTCIVMYRNNIITKYRSIEKKSKTFIYKFFIVHFCKRNWLVTRKRVLRHIFGNVLRQKKHVQPF